MLQLLHSMCMRSAVKGWEDGDITLSGQDMFMPCNFSSSCEHRNITGLEPILLAVFTLKLMMPYSATQYLINFTLK